MSLVLIGTELELNLRPESLALAIEFLSRKDQAPIHLLVALEVRLQRVDQVIELSGGDSAALVCGLPGGYSAIRVGGCGEGGGGREVGAFGREQRESDAHVGCWTTRDGLEDVACDERACWS